MALSKSQPEPKGGMAKAIKQRIKCPETTGYTDLVL